MAKKRAKKTVRRRRRIGGMKLNAKNPLVKFGPIVAGFLLADKINPQIDKITGTMDAKIVGAAQTGLGAALVFMKLGKKPLPVVVTMAGGVLAGSGLKRALKSFGIMNGIGGYQSVPVIGNRRRMNGYQSVPVLGAAGYTPGPGALNGYSVPKPMSIMGSTGNGSGISTGSELMG